jgi:hypothetical protein
MGVDRDAFLPDRVSSSSLEGLNREENDGLLGEEEERRGDVEEGWNDVINKRSCSINT